MLCYLGSGVRRYGDKSVHIHIRPFWEFQAVLEGEIGMQLPKGKPLLAKRQLWLSAPGHAHGWVGKPNEQAHVAVFHFLSIPELVKRRFRKTQCLAIPLTSEQCERLKALSLELADSWRSPQPDMLLRHEHLLLELSLIVADSDAAAPSPADAQRRERVNAALNWFHLHMQLNPSLEEIARAAGASTAHLRRLFHEVMEAPPKQIFDQLRFQRAIHLMTEQGAKLESVSQDCGFQSASAFSRAFKLKFGCSPNEWRGAQRPSKRR